MFFSKEFVFNIFEDVFIVEEEIEIISKIILDEFEESSFKILPLIGKGFVNKVFLVETESSKYIFRTNDENSIDEYEKERWAANRANKQQIPAPQILKIGVFDDQAYSIQKYVEGVEGRDLTADKKFIWRKLGECAKKIHEIKTGGFGLKFGDMTRGNSRKLWLEYLNYNIESLNDKDELLKLNVLTKAQSEKAKEIFKHLKLKDFTFGLNHGDLSLKNTIIDEFGTVHLIDWGSAEASIVPHHDLIQLLKVKMQENSFDESEFEAFLEGCEISRNEYKQMLPELEALLLLRAFDKLRWAIGRKIPEIEVYIIHAKEAADKILIL